MIRRAIAAVICTGAAIALPVAAASALPAYPAPGDSLNCSVTQVAPDGTFTCTIGGEDGASATLSADCPGGTALIDGLSSPQTKTIAANVASFTVTAPSVDCTLGLTAMIDDVAVDSAAVEVSATLSATGFENTGLAVGAGALLVIGASVVFITARRRSAQNA